MAISAAIAMYHGGKLIKNFFSTLTATFLTPIVVSTPHKAQLPTKTTLDTMSQLIPISDVPLTQVRPQTGGLVETLYNVFRTKKSSKLELIKVC